MDIIAPQERSALMARIRGKHTRPELAVRRAAHALGFRFRLHRRDLPGAPDLAFPRLRKVVLVHGCFWHQHAGCPYAYKPKSRQEFWHLKFQANARRDQVTLSALKERNWDVLVVWECETWDLKVLSSSLAAFLNRPGAA